MGKKVNKKTNKIKIIYILFLLSLTCNNKINSGGIIDVITKGIELPQPETPKISFGEVGKAEQQIRELKNDLAKLKEKDAEFKTLTNKKILDVNTEIKKINSQMKISPQSIDFFNNKLEIINDTYQDIKDMQSLRKQIELTIEEHINILENYIKDPNFKEIIIEFAEQKKFYSFEDLQKINQLMLLQEDKIKLLEEQKQNTQIELENREQTSEITKEIYEKKLRELDGFKKNPDTTSLATPMFGLNKDQKLDILTFQEILYKNKKELNSLKLSEIKNKLDITKTNLFLENLKLNILKKTANDIKPAIKISESDILYDKATLEKQKSESYKIIGKFKAEISKINTKYETDRKILEKNSKEYNIPINELLNEWDVNPLTKNDYTKIINLGKLNEELSTLKKEKELYNAQVLKNEEELYQIKINIETKDTFYKVETRKLISEKDISNEIKRYKKIKLDLDAKTAKIKENLNITKENLKNKNKAIENINKLKQKLINLITDKPSPLFSAISTSDAKIKQQIKYMQDSIDIYENILSINTKIEKQLLFILSVLEQLVGKWYRPEYAIKFEKLPNIIPELKIFISDLINYFKKFNLSDFFEQIKTSIPKELNLINFFLMLIIAIIFLFLFIAYAPKIRNHLLGSGKKNTSLDQPDNLVKFFSNSIAFLLDFTIKYFFSISIWLITFLTIRTIIIQDRYILITFYLVSIIYFIYLANRLLNHFWTFNKKYNVLTFIEQKYQKRFITIISIITYSTIALQFFRKAFELGIYFPSELPAVLSALNWIIGQIALILLITKEFVKKILPKSWLPSAENYNNFYHFILLSAVIIIIMSNPYIGLGRLLLYTIQRTLLSLILIIGLLMLHKIGKTLSLKLLFKSDDEAILSRFTYGKTIYGIYIISSFIIIIFIGILIGSYIWDLGISFGSISKILNKILFIYEGNEISTISLIEIFGFLTLGLIFSELINKYVLNKIFDLLLVESGVQHTVKSILKYIIIIIFTIIGFNFAGLGKLVIYLLAILLIAIGWVIQEPLKDFIYYFLILIQRPLKIGDYVQLNDGSKDVQGVVRRITPRAVILKFRNSESISIPNSKVLTNSLVNFNYHSRYIAFEDIKVTIGYKYDPEKVKTIILDVFDNHPNILKSPKPIFRIENFGEYGYVFAIRGFISAQYTLDMWDIASDIRFEITKALKENHIDIAIPISIWKSVD
ncbi:MAG: hypothetical protein UR12_C0025G0019 [candidate division TM6 bacterium GW2011_GWF2_30_66]|nr:MAG: hypothetical protein UR12_C0025G0019 [candidate division TM6 bacterium GW2011_GWF2_30_66]